MVYFRVLSCQKMKDIFGLVMNVEFLIHNGQSPKILRPRPLQLVMMTRSVVFWLVKNLTIDKFFCPKHLVDILVYSIKLVTIEFLCTLLIYILYLFIELCLFIVSK